MTEHEDNSQGYRAATARHAGSLPRLPRPRHRPQGALGSDLGYNVVFKDGRRGGLALKLESRPPRGRQRQISSSHDEMTLAQVYSFGVLELGRSAHHRIIVKVEKIFARLDLPSSNTPTAKQITDRLQTISAVDLQVVAEQLAHTLFPERFSAASLVIRGRNSHDQTTKGWPDAYVEAEDNRVHAIEATRQSNWEAHVSDDYEKAAGKKNRDLASYFFVGVGDPGARVDAVEKAKWIRKFEALGLERESVNILVGLDLVTILQDRRCARIRLTYLKLRTSPRVFSLLVPGEMPSLASSLYQPNIDDFAANRVFTPEITPQVSDKLTRTGRALVRGYGAAGKTTLAQVLASLPELSSQPFYYMDLAAVSDLDRIVNEVTDDMVEFGGVGTTFAIDNIHLHESAARRIVSQWIGLPETVRPKLLLLGREQKNLNGSPLGAIEPLVLRAGEAALMGVLARLLGRIGARVPTISGQQMNQWIDTFGGNSDAPDSSVDLVAFSAAVERRIPAIARGQLTLTPEDAVDGVRSHYWQPVHGTPEADNLLRLAALAQVEIEATEELLPRRDAGLARSIASGLVIADSGGGELRVRYKLAHPALAQLLQSAVGITDGGKAERLAASLTSIPAAFRLANVGSSFAERSEALNIATASVPDGRWINTCANLYELCTVITSLLGKERSLRTALDLALSMDEGLFRLSAATRNVSNWIRALTVFHDRQFSLSLEAIRNSTVAQIMAGNAPTFFHAAPAHETAAFLQRHPAGVELRSAIDAQVWAEAHLSYARPVFVSETVMAATWFAERGREDLARPLCDRQIADADPGRWLSAGISHLSHLVRLSSQSGNAIRHLLEVLEAGGWLADEITNARTGDLSGALFSMSNHMPDGCLPGSFLTLLETRVAAELRSGMLRDGETGLRALSLLGSASRFLPQYAIPSDLGLPSDERVDAMIRARVRKVDVGQIGTHEIQLWLGIMKLSEKTTVRLDNEQTARMIRLLEITPTPSLRGAETKKALLSWLRTSSGEGDIGSISAL